MMTERAELVFIPCPLMGHAISMVEVVKLLVDREETLSATVLVTKLDHSSTAKALVDYVSTSYFSSRIRFVELPPLQPGNASGPGATVDLIGSLEGIKPNVRDLVLGLTKNSGSDSSLPRLAGFVIDMFCITMLDVAEELRVPSYIFYTSSVNLLGISLYLQALKDDHQLDISALADPDASVDYPGFTSPVPSRFLPSVMRDMGSASVILKFTRRFRETKGILVNTFEGLEARAMESAFDDKVPPVYPVGPILNLRSLVDEDDAGAADALDWLDKQPPASVVFLCFGSMGSFPEEQVRQIAHALERTGHRFLWSLRRPRQSEGKFKFEFASSYENPEEIFPDGFMDRTAGKGKIIGWASQVQVLAHPAVGGFVSHCGWNSVLESIWFGVPMAVWPLFADQQLNAFALVEDLGVAVDIRMDYSCDNLSGKRAIVPAEEIERGINRLMDTEVEAKEKMKRMSEKSRRAKVEGGSSQLNLERFIKNMHLN
ncbi:hypothetical protein SAY86_028681 [Trapa natans]|uniref:Glycosyltransferase n=1 Tax=Trapa natans TaxID=22666 RepID=A0AAN7RCF2_TRANT|nr:hypothetical protein SAY86_028681 [Trapa natans]